MKAVAFGALAASVGAVAVIAACGGSSPSSSGTMGGANNFANSGSGNGNSGGVCNSNCSSDMDCANNCNAPPNGESYCCDTAAGVCVAFGGSSCPAPKNGGTGGDNASNPGSGSGGGGNGNSGSSNGGGSGGSGGSSSGGGGGGGMCPAMCMADSDCQNSCPMASNGGTNCCDTSMGMCFVSTSSTCPVSDAGAPVSD